MNKIINCLLSIILAVAFITGMSGQVSAASKVDLGSADNFAVLAGSSINNSGPSVVNGDLFLSPGSSITGFPPGINIGKQGISDDLAAQAQADLSEAYGALGEQKQNIEIPSELGGSIRTAGVYKSATGIFTITGSLILDAQGDPNAVFIFRTSAPNATPGVISGPTLVTAARSSVVLLNGAQACNVYWQVGSSAILGESSVFSGNIIALDSATLTTGARVDGRVLVRNGPVALDSNTITKATCAGSSVPGLPSTGDLQNFSLPWNLVLLAGIFIALALFYVIHKNGD